MVYRRLRVPLPPVAEIKGHTRTPYVLSVPLKAGFNPLSNLVVNPTIMFYAAPPPPPRGTGGWEWVAL